MSNFREKLYNVRKAEIGIYHKEDYFGPHKYGYQVYNTGKPKIHFHTYKDKEIAIMTAKENYEKYKKEYETVLMKVVQRLAISVVLITSCMPCDRLYAQAPEKEVDQIFVPSPFFLDEFPEENICSIKVQYADDVDASSFNADGCLKYRNSDETIFRGECGGAGGGFNFDSARAPPSADFIIPVEYAQHSSASLVNFTTGPCPSNFGPNCYSIEPNATVGSITQGVLDPDVVLISNHYLVYDANYTQPAVAVWIGTTRYALEPTVQTGLTLGTRIPDFSVFKDQLPGNNWQGVKIEWKDGTFSPNVTDARVQATADKATLKSYLGIENISPSQENIYHATKAILKAGTDVSIAESDTNHTLTLNSTATGGGSDFIALNALPSNNDLNNYKIDQVLRVKSYTRTLSGGFTFNVPASWRRVIQLTEWGHGIKATVAEDSSGNRGFSIIASTPYGGLTQVDNSRSLFYWNSPIGRIIYQSNNNISVYILKSRLTTEQQALSTIYMRVYNSAPSVTSDVSTSTLTKGSEFTYNDGFQDYVYQTYSGTGEEAGPQGNPPGSYADIATWSSSYANPLYFTFYTQDPADTESGQHDNPLELFNERGTTQIDPPAQNWATDTFTPIPAYKLSNAPNPLDYNIAEADPEKSLKILTEETTPFRAGVTRTESSTFSFENDGTYTYRNSLSLASNSVYSRVFGTRSLANANILLLNFYSSGHATSSLRNKYELKVLDTFVVSANSYQRYVPIKLEIDNGGSVDEYNFNANGTTIDDGATGTNTISFLTDVIPLQDRAGTSSPRDINIELRYNLYLVETPNIFLSTMGTGPPEDIFRTNRLVHADVSYRLGRVYYNSNLGGVQGDSQNELIIRYIVAGANDRITGKTGRQYYYIDLEDTNQRNTLWVGKTISHIVVNGKEFPVTHRDDTLFNSHPGYYTTDAITDTDFAPSNINYSYTEGDTSVPIPSGTRDYGFNVKFTDGTYASETIIHAFQRTIQPTPESKVQKVLTKSGAKEWLGIVGDTLNYNEPNVDLKKEFKVGVQEKTPGTKEDKNIALGSSGSNYTNATPFPGVNRLTFNADSSETDLLNRYSVNVPLIGGDDTDPPVLLQIGTTNYSLSYYETDAGQAIYRTPVVATANRVSSVTTINAVNIQFKDGSWAGQTGESTALKTLTKAQLQSLSNEPAPVHTLPTSPTTGQRIEALNSISVPNCALMTAGEFSTSTAQYIGYLDASSRTATTDLGSLVPKNSNIAGLLSYPASHNNSTFRNRTVFQDRGTYNPTTSGKVIINGTEYAITNLQSNDYWALTGLDGSFIKNSEKYCINVKNGSGTLLYPNTTLAQGARAVYDGFKWIPEKISLDQTEVDARVNTLISDWAKKINTDTIPTNKLCTGGVMTLTQYRAITNPTAGKLYCTSGP